MWRLKNLKKNDKISVPINSYEWQFERLIIINDQTPLRQT